MTDTTRIDLSHQECLDIEGALADLVQTLDADARNSLAVITRHAARIQTLLERVRAVRERFSNIQQQD